MIIYIYIYVHVYNINIYIYTTYIYIHLIYVYIHLYNICLFIFTHWHDNYPWYFAVRYFKTKPHPHVRCLFRSLIGTVMNIPRFVVDDILMATLICLGCDTLWIDLWLWDFKHYIYMQWWCCWWWWWRRWWRWRWRWWRRLQSQRTLRNDDHNDFIQSEQHPNRFTNSINSCNYNNSNDNRNSNSNSSNENYNSNSR